MLFKQQMPNLMSLKWLPDRVESGELGDISDSNFRFPPRGFLKAALTGVGVPLGIGVIFKLKRGLETMASNGDKQSPSKPPLSPLGTNF